MPSETQLRIDVGLARWSMRLGIANALIVPACQIYLLFKEGRWSWMPLRSVLRIDSAKQDKVSDLMMIANALLDTPLVIFTIIFGATWWYVSRIMLKHALEALQPQDAMEKFFRGG